MADKKETGRRLALVTGGGRGIGRAIALKLGEKGFDVAVNYNNSAAAAEELCEELSARGASARAFKADVSKAGDVASLFKSIEESMGTVQVLVNNAGITRDNLLMRMKEEEWTDVVAANLNSAFYCTKEAIRGMVRARWGRVVCIASVVGLMGNAGQANYSATKAGLIGFAKSVAREYAAKGVTVNVVAPGFIETDMTSVLKENVRTAMLRQIPAGRMGSPEDVARIVAFFASDESEYVTGQILAVDGGMTMC
ncbi:MAG: 3-oxoacyl-[acyl-carrier-protein] reductase [Synergistaceae bacterium]|jgi:3-oxoacyl-[acyl-carrier protein] reductase|nr:3-oxoacyl-[acyl-carrier-protein] reductase [Synergistaceae bacterium]